MMHSMINSHDTRAKSIPTEWLPPLEGFLTHLKAVGRPDTTIGTRRQQIAQLSRAVGKPPAEVTYDDLIEYHAGRSWALDTRRGHRNAAVAFFRWAHATGRIPTDPAADMPIVKASVPAPRPAPDRVVQVGLATPEKRTQLMLRLSCEVGLRRAEVAHVSTTDIEDGAGGALLRVHGKGGKVRVIPISDDLASTIERGGRVDDAYPAAQVRDARLPRQPESAGGADLARSHERCHDAAVHGRRRGRGARRDDVRRVVRSDDISSDYTRLRRLSGKITPHKGQEQEPTHRMTNQPPQQPYPGQPYPQQPTPPKKNTTRNIIIGIAVAVVALCGIGVIVAAVSGGDTKDETVATSTTTVVSTPAATTTETTQSTTTSTTTKTSAAPTLLTIPDGLVGMNGQLAMEKLTDMGFTSVMPASADPAASVPLLLSNWEVTEVEPGAGTKVKADSTIILTMVKK